MPFTVAGDLFGDVVVQGVVVEELVSAIEYLKVVFGRAEIGVGPEVFTNNGCGQPWVEIQFIPEYLHTRPPQ